MGGKPHSLCSALAVAFVGLLAATSQTASATTTGSLDIVTAFGQQYDCTKLGSYGLPDIELETVKNRCGRGLPAYPGELPGGSSPTYKDVMPSCAQPLKGVSYKSFCGSHDDVNDMTNGTVRYCTGPGELYTKRACQPDNGMEGICRWRKFCDADAQREASIGLLSSVLNANAYSSFLLGSAASAICLVNRTASTWDRFAPSTVSTVEDMIRIRAMGVLMADMELSDDAVAAVAGGTCIDRVDVWTGGDLEGDSAEVCQSCLDVMESQCGHLLELYNGLQESTTANPVPLSLAELAVRALGCASKEAQEGLAKMVRTGDLSEERKFVDAATAARDTVLNFPTMSDPTSALGKLEPILVPLARRVALETLLPVIARTAPGSSDCVLASYADGAGSTGATHVGRIQSVRSLLRNSPTFRAVVMAGSESHGTAYARFVQLLRPLEHVAQMALNPQDGLFHAWIHNDYVSVAMAARDHVTALFSAKHWQTSKAAAIAFRGIFCGTDVSAQLPGKMFRIAPFLSHDACDAAETAILTPKDTLIAAAVAAARREPRAVSVGVPRMVQLFAILAQIPLSLRTYLPEIAHEVMLQKVPDWLALDSHVRPFASQLASVAAAAAKVQENLPPSSGGSDSARNAAFNKAIQCQLSGGCPDEDTSSTVLGRRLLAATLRRSAREDAPVLAPVVPTASTPASAQAVGVDTAIIGSPSIDYGHSLDMSTVRHAFGSRMHEDDDDGAVTGSLPGSGSRRLGIETLPRNSLEELERARATSLAKDEISFPPMPAGAGGVMRFARGEAQKAVSNLFDDASESNGEQQTRNAKLLSGLTRVAVRTRDLLADLLRFTSCRCEQSLQVEAMDPGRLLGTQARVESVTPCWQDPLAEDCVVLNGVNALRHVGGMLSNARAYVTDPTKAADETRKDLLGVLFGHTSVKRSRTEQWLVPFSLLPGRSPLTSAAANCPTRECFTQSSRVQSKFETSICCSTESKFLRAASRILVASWQGFLRASQDATNRRKKTVSDDHGCIGCALVWESLSKKFPMSVRANTDSVALHSAWRHICEGMVSVFIPVCKEMEGDLPLLLEQWSLNDASADELCEAYCPPTGYGNVAAFAN